MVLIKETVGMERDVGVCKDALTALNFLRITEPKLKARKDFRGGHFAKDLAECENDPCDWFYCGEFNVFIIRPIDFIQ